VDTAGYEALYDIDE
jgi:predicted GTPase